MFRVAAKEWGVRFPHLDINDIRHKAKEKAIVVRFEPVDIENVKADIWKRQRISDERKQLYQDCFVFSIETGVRLSELLTAQTTHYSRHFRIIKLLDTKSGEDRIVGLSPVAIEIAERRLAARDEYLFPIELYALRSLFRRLFPRIGLNGRRWHDIRHEALSSFFEKGLTAPEVQLQAGHKDLRTTTRYSHAKLDNILSKLESAGSKCTSTRGCS
jgi:integrase